jgi:hypothetical protein
MSWLGGNAASQHFLSQRTVVDVRCLRESMEALLSNKELRSEMGQNARQRAVSEFSSDLISRHFARLWRSQLESKADDPPRSPPLDYGGMFRHYATAALDLDHEICVTERGKLLLGKVNDGTDLLPVVLQEDIRNILAAEDGPVRIDRSVSRGSPVSFEAIVWLLKRGYLELDRV